MGRWERQEIAFRRREVNPRLRECWGGLGLRRGDPVLVPLCGKSEDLWWLRTQGHPVLGVELSPRAAAAFYAEHLTGSVARDASQRRLIPTNLVSIKRGHFQGAPLSADLLPRSGLLEQLAAGDAGPSMLSPTAGLRAGPAHLTLDPLSRLVNMAQSHVIPPAAPCWMAGAP